MRERIIIPAPEETSKSIDAVKGKLSRSEFIRRAILHEIERVLTAKLKRTKRKPGRVLINAQIAAGYALTLRLRHHWYWYFWLQLSKK